MSSDLEHFQEYIESIDDDTNKLVFGFIHSSQKSFNDHIINGNLYTRIPESIYLECLLFYYIDYEKSESMGLIYDMFIDPTFCSTPVYKHQWVKSMQEIDFEYDIEVQQQLFDIMKQNEESDKIYKSDFIIFTTSIFHPVYQTHKNLQDKLLEAINIIDAKNQEYIDREAKVKALKDQKRSKVLYQKNVYILL